MDMVYVAEDRKQPGAAYAIVIDDGKYLDDLATTIAGWAKDGALVRHVDRETGLAMLDKWLRPARKG